MKKLKTKDGIECSFISGKFEKPDEFDMIIINVAVRLGNGLWGVLRGKTNGDDMDDFKRKKSMTLTEFKRLAYLGVIKISTRLGFISDWQVASKLFPKLDSQLFTDNKK